VSAWFCMRCGAHDEGELDGDICPKCGHGDKRLTVWLCCECWSEGIGQRPDECPTCGCADSWYMTTTGAADPRPAKVLYDEMLDRIFSPSKRKH